MLGNDLLKKVPSYFKIIKMGSKLAFLCQLRTYYKHSIKNIRFQVNVFTNLEPTWNLTWNPTWNLINYLI